MKKLTFILAVTVILVLAWPGRAYACDGLLGLVGICLDDYNQQIQDGMTDRAALDANTEINQQNNETARALAEQQAAITQKSLELAETAIREPNETQRELARSLAVVGQQGVIGSAAVQIAEAQAEAQTEMIKTVGNVLIVGLIVVWLYWRSRKMAE